MKDLIKTPHDFVTSKSAIGSYAGVHTDEVQYVFLDKNEVPFLVPIDPWTKKAVEQIMVGTVCQIEKTNNGFDVYTLDETEVDEWRSDKHGK